MTSSPGARPTDTWRVCGQPVTTPERPDQRGRGCACSGFELFNDKTLLAALARLSTGPAGDPPNDDTPNTAPRR